MVRSGSGHNLLLLGLPAQPGERPTSYQPPLMQCSTPKDPIALPLISSSANNVSVVLTLALLSISFVSPSWLHLESRKKILFETRVFYSKYAIFVMAREMPMAFFEIHPSLPCYSDENLNGSKSKQMYCWTLKYISAIFQLLTYIGALKIVTIS